MHAPTYTSSYLYLALCCSLAPPKEPCIYACMSAPIFFASPPAFRYVCHADQRAMTALNVASAARRSLAARLITPDRCATAGSEYVTSLYLIFHPWPKTYSYLINSFKLLDPPVTQHRSLSYCEGKSIVHGHVALPVCLSLPLPGSAAAWLRRCLAALCRCLAPPLPGSAAAWLRYAAARPRNAVTAS